MRTDIREITERIKAEQRRLDEVEDQALVARSAEVRAATKRAEAEQDVASIRRGLERLRNQQAALLAEHID